MPVKTRRSSAFTLVELLVVIGIIALLISILLPALSAAKEHANTVKCAANLRSVGQWMLTYANDNKGKVPLDYWYDASGDPQYTNGHIFWAESFAISFAHDKSFPTRVPPTANRDQTLAPFLRRIGVYQCPSYPDDASPLDFAINGWAGSGIISTSTNSSSGMLPITKIKYSANIIYLTEKKKGMPNDYFMQSDIWQDSHLAYNPNNRQPNPDAGVRMINDRRHRGLANALYCDGHVLAKSIKEFTPKDFNPLLWGRTP